MAQGWGTPRRATLRRGITDPAMKDPGHTPTPSDGVGVCGHLVAVHTIKPGGGRGSCTHADATGPCDCSGCEVAT